MNKRIKTITHILTAVVAIAVFIYWGMTVDLDLNVLLSVLGSVRLEFFLIVILLGVINVYLRIFRFKRILLFHGSRVRIKKIIPIFFMGFFVGSLTPMRAGEPIKAVLLRDNEKVPLPTGMASIFIERILDMMLIVVFVIIGLMYAMFPVLVINNWLLFLLLILTIGGYIFLIFGISNKNIKGFIDRVLLKINKPYGRALRRGINNFSENMANRSGKQKALATAEWLIPSLIIFITEGLSLLILFKALGADVGLMETIVVLCLSSLVGLISQTPGGVVTTEFSFAYLFTLVGQTSEVGLAAILLARFIGYYSFMVIGGVLSVRKSIEKAIS